MSQCVPSVTKSTLLSPGSVVLVLQPRSKRVRGRACGVCMAGRVKTHESKSLDTLWRCPVECTCVDCGESKNAVVRRCLESVLIIGNQFSNLYTVNLTLAGDGPFEKDKGFLSAEQGLHEKNLDVPHDTARYQ